MSPLPPEAEKFLKEVRRAMDSEERDDVIDELRSHLCDRVAQGRSDPLEGFEDPAELAAGFVSERALRGALSQGTPWSMARAILVSAKNSLTLLFALGALVLVQVVAFCFVLTAVLKPFSPSELGLWVGNGNFYVGRSTPAAHEVLGLWGIPILLFVGVLLFWASTRGLRALARSRLASHRLGRS